MDKKADKLNELKGNEVSASLRVGVLLHDQLSNAALEDLDEDGFLKCFDLKTGRDSEPPYPGIGCRVTFIPNGEEFDVASGDGLYWHKPSIVVRRRYLPASMLELEEYRERAAVGTTMSVATRWLLGYRLTPDREIWDLWSYKGKKLSELYDVFCREEKL